MSCKRRKNKSERIARNREFIKSLKEETGCFKCGEKDYRVLQFHHVDPSLKESGISELLQRDYSLTAIKKEIEKCEVVCANCHLKIHN